MPQVHYLSGPINVKDADGKLAQPGDLLAVELCQLGPLPGACKLLYILETRLKSFSAIAFCARPALAGTLGRLQDSHSSILCVTEASFIIGFALPQATSGASQGSSTETTAAAS